MNHGTGAEKPSHQHLPEIGCRLASTEKMQDLARQILDHLNHSESGNDLIRDILFSIKATSDFEAVGIRLREGEDYPYYDTSGFPEEFVKAERFLCARDGTGDLIRDSQGNPVLECMCGNVISGRTDSSLPFFTEGGSFWTNSTSALLASTTEKDRQGRTRNRCNGEGYESVALIPLLADRKVIGLIQLNDRRKNLFTLKLIQFFEGIAPSIGIASRLRETAERQASRNTGKEEPSRAAHRLSPRERTILGLIASGKSAREIGELLFISIRTVTTHRTRIMQKLNVHKTADLVRYALSRGLNGERESR